MFFGSFRSISLKSKREVIYVVLNYFDKKTSKFLQARDKIL